MIIFLGLVLGVLIGLFVPVTIPTEYSKYISIVFLAALDSVLGGIRARVEEKFDSVIFISGFLGNALLAGLLTYGGDRLGIDLYLAAIVTFGVRLFDNLAAIRRLVILRRKVKST